MMEILYWSSFGQLMDQNTLNLAISTVSNHKPISMFTKLNRFKLKMTCQSNEQMRIAPGWHHVKSSWSFSTRAISLLNNCPKSILTTKCKKKHERSHKSAYPPDHIQLFNTHWSTVLMGSMWLDRAANGDKGLEGELRAHGDKERCSIPTGN